VSGHDDPNESSTEAPEGAYADIPPAADESGYMDVDAGVNF